MGILDTFAEEIAAFHDEVREGAGTTFLRKPDGIEIVGFLRDLEDDEYAYLDPMPGPDGDPMNAEEMRVQVLDLLPVDTLLGNGNYLYPKDGDPEAERAKVVVGPRKKPLAGQVVKLWCILQWDPKV